MPFYLLVLALSVLVMRHYQHQPSKVTVAYRLGPARDGLQRLQARYSNAGDTEVLHRVSFSFGDGKSLEPQHALSLPDGDFDVWIDLDYRERVPPAIRSTSRPLGSRRVRMRRPLLVRGDGRVSIFIAEDDD